MKMNTNFKILLIFATLLFLLFFIFSQPSFSFLEKSSAEAAKEFKPLSKLPLVIFWLVIVSLMSTVTLKYLGTKGILRGTFNKKHLIKILERQVVGPKQTILLIHAAGKYLLIGQTDQSFTTLAELASDQLNLEEQEEKADSSTYIKNFLKERLPFFKNNKG